MLEVCCCGHRETGHLGSGEFGTVNRGVWLDGARSVDVAIKKLKDDCCEEEAVRFLQEAAIMGQFRHPNIVQLLGVVTIVKPVGVSYCSLHSMNLYKHSPRR
jgi:serine/threonine protein kinase